MRCCICGHRITGTAWVCNRCAIEWALVGLPVSSWPSWVQALVQIERGERNHDAAASGRELSLEANIEREEAAANAAAKNDHRYAPLGICGLDDRVPLVQLILAKLTKGV